LAIYQADVSLALWLHLPFLRSSDENPGTAHMVSAVRSSQAINRFLFASSTLFGYASFFVFLFGLMN
jgi:hypothetical protein